MKITSTGIRGLDYVLNGGLPEGATIVLEGSPGSGKTTLALQYLCSGATEHGQSGIYVTFEELPSQLYDDMKTFGWDLRDLERRDLLRVLCIAPDMFMEQLMNPTGLFEHVFDEINCRRVVIDSISLLSLRTAETSEQRREIYKLRNVLRKKGMTALLIREQSGVRESEFPFEHFVVDGVIRLTVGKKDERYRERVLEIMKMRGRAYIEGEHVYRITNEGVHLLPSITVHSPGNQDDARRMSTGIPRLDEALFGGIPKGTVFMFDTNSKAHYGDLSMACLSQMFLHGVKGLILPSNLASLHDIVKEFEVHGVSVAEYVNNKSLYIIEHYNRPCPKVLEPALYNVADLDDTQFKEYIDRKLGPLIGHGLKQGEEWFAYYDLNTMLSERGENFVTRYFAEQAANARAYGVTMFVLCNFEEIDPKVASFLERSCDGVIRTWVDRTYQYLQVTKEPSGKASEIFIVETIGEKPFVRLI